MSILGDIEPHLDFDDKDFVSKKPLYEDLLAKLKDQLLKINTFTAFEPPSKDNYNLSVEQQVYCHQWISGEIETLISIVENQFSVYNRSKTEIDKRVLDKLSKERDK